MTDAIIIPIDFGQDPQGDVILVYSDPDSELVRDHIAYRQRHYPNAHAGALDRNHHVVTGHDIYHEILARHFTASTIPNRGLTDPRLLRLIACA